MKYHIFTCVSLMLVIGCGSQPSAHMPNDDSLQARTSGGLQRQEAIAKEIVSIEYAFAEAMFHTNGVVFEAQAGPLVDRLDKISKELDTLGPFPASLRESTLKKLDRAEKDLAERFQSGKASGSLQQGSMQSDMSKITDKYFLAWTSVMTKAGLNLKPNGEK